MLHLKNQENYQNRIIKKNSEDQTKKNGDKSKGNQGKKELFSKAGNVQISDTDRNGKTYKRKPLANEKPEISNTEQDLELTEDQLNNAPFEKAKKNDSRTWSRYYWSLLKAKQLFIFTFYTSGDYILRSTKIALFILLQLYSLMMI